MTIRNLNRLLDPRSVALIGASNRIGSVGRIVAENLVRARFAGQLFFVNPKHQALLGQPVHPDVESLPAAPDLAVIATPPRTVPKLIEQLGTRGTRAAVIISAGLGESTGGQDLMKAALAAARPRCLRILGPNCLGLMRPAIGLNASFAHLDAPAGGIALLSQSGAILTSVLDWAAARAVGFSHLVSMGDMADVDFGDLIDYLALDPQTSAILLYMEAVTHPRKFMSAARRAARTKPVIVIKAGRQAETARAVASHTGALAGADAVYDAAFRRAGMLRVGSLDELFAAVATLAAVRRPKGDRLGILTNGGGIGILATDALIETGCRLAALAPETTARLDKALPPTWSRGNPVDIVGDAPPARYAAACEILLAAPEIDGLLVLNCPTGITASADAARAVIAAVGDRAQSQCVLTGWIGEKTAEEARRLLAAARLPTYETPEAAVRAFGHMVRYWRNQDLLMETPPSIPREFTPDVAAARSVIETVLAEGREILSEPEARAVLRSYAIDGPEIRVAASPGEAAAQARAIGGPVALKILSPDISHKSDVGGVVLGLKTPEAVEDAAVQMLARVAGKLPRAHITGFTVASMIDRPGSHELIVGMSEDPQFGPVILFGQGGVAVEVVADRALALPPLNLKLARELMRETRAYKLLQGYRDRPPAALDAIALALMHVSQLVVDLPEVIELDINPLLADPQGVIALDARIRVRPAARPGTARLAIRPYPRELEELVTMPDGRQFLIRPIRPEDEPALRAGFARLSPESIRRRFHMPLKTMTHAMAALLTQIDYDREMALVLTAPPAGDGGTPDGYGVARLAADPDNERAEFALVIRDDMTGQGLGSMLLERLVAYARARGIKELVGDVLPDNTAMLNLCRRLGFGATPPQAGGDPVKVRLAIQNTAGGLP